MRVEAMALALILSLVALPARTDDHDDEAGPELDFLEFLGEFETADGVWLDPIQLIEQDATATTTEKAQ